MDLTMHWDGMALHWILSAAAAFAVLVVLSLFLLMISMRRIRREMQRLSTPAKPAAVLPDDGQRAPTPQQQHLKYLALAEAAEKAGDRYNAENFYQHADHWFRVMREGTPPDT